MLQEHPGATFLGHFLPKGVNPGGSEEMLQNICPSYSLKLFPEFMRIPEHHLGISVWRRSRADAVRRPVEGRSVVPRTASTVSCGF